MQLNHDFLLDLNAMNSKIGRLESEIASLTSEERAELDRSLINTPDTGPEEGVEAAWDDELARRSAAIQAGAITGKSAEQVFASIRSRFCQGS